ncbi:N-acetylmuramic acid 6-phosphate etherase [Krasilnikovia sp. MM14-A1259]|uniref:N-acetylmuramic acid 6-phosphate etherase n=1 Tax=Krasilnikovia sp. MM14-A1259 TaxID=3373539 RepID=UPI00399D46C7
MPRADGSPDPTLSALVTESRRPDLADLDLRPTGELVALMHADGASVTSAVERALPRVAAAIDAITARMARGGRLIYAGAGTAGRLGVLDASECPPTFGVASGTVVALIAGGAGAMQAAVEGAEDDAGAAAADLDRSRVAECDSVVAVTASGRTPYAVGAATHARERGALVVGLACTPDPPLATVAHHMIEVVVGPELISGSTRLKAGTAQKLVLNMISTVVMVRLGRTYGDLMVDLHATNDKLRVRAARIVAQAADVPAQVAAAALDAAAGEVKPAIVHLVRGVDVAAARELLAAHDGRLRAVLRA